MTYGPSIIVYDINESDFESKKEIIINLMREVDIGTEHERIYVARYITNMLSEEDQSDGDRMRMFAYLNHKPNQDVEDYDVLCDLFESYGKIVGMICLSDVFVESDGRNYLLLIRDEISYKISYSSRIDNDEFIDELKLKVKIQEGKEAEKLLKEKLK